MIFLDIAPKIGFIKFYFIANKNFANDTIKETKQNKTKKWATDWDKILTYHISSEGFISRIYTRLSKLNNKTETMKKNGQNIWRLHQKIYMDGKKHR